MRRRVSVRRAQHQALPPAPVGLDGELEVLPDGVLLEHRRLLELASDAGLRDRGLGQPRHVDRLAEEHVPASGRVLPVMTSIIVVLPAPFGPITQRSSPSSIASDSASSALKPSKLTLTSSR